MIFPTGYLDASLTISPLIYLPLQFPVTHELTEYILINSIRGLLDVLVHVGHPPGTGTK